MRDREESVLGWLQQWYARHCDGDWEHSYGVQIDTLDNPGWQVSIDLNGTALEQRPFAPVRWDRDDADWLHCRVAEHRFEGFGGPHNLTDILLTFQAWAVEGN